MNCGTLTEYLQLTAELLAESSCYAIDEIKVDERSFNYLYFGTTVERLPIHRLEDSAGSLFSTKRKISYQRQLQLDICDFKPNFDRELIIKGIVSIEPFPSRWLYDRVTDSYKKNYRKTIKEIQKRRGILNALLTVRDQAHFPDNCKGSKNRSRVALSYLKNVVLPYLERELSHDEQIKKFLNWCRKKTRKRLPREPREKEFRSTLSSSTQIHKELRSPPAFAIPIHVDEAVAYIKYFLKGATSSGRLYHQQSEMVVFLSLCLASARRWSNHFDPIDILNITNSDMRSIQEIPKNRLKDCDNYVVEKSITSNSPSLLSLGLSSDFLLEDDLWAGNPDKQDAVQRSYIRCHSILIGGADILITQSLATAIERMGKFSVTKKDVENRLKEAYETVGLSQSSKGISPRSFLVNPHHLENHDARHDARKD